MSEQKAASLSRRLGLLGLLGVLRAWLPSIMVHAAILLILTFVTIGVGSIGDDGNEEFGVSVVMREESQQEQRQYLDQEQFEEQVQEQQREHEQQREQLQISDLEDLQVSEVEAQPIIGLQAQESGGAAVAGGAAGGGSQVSFFGLQGTGKRVVFVVDRSGSMNGDLLQAAKEELMKSITQLPRGARYAVCFFSDGPYWMPAYGGESLVRSSRGRNQQVFKWIGQVKAQGGTQPLAALSGALDLKPDMVFFLTDGAFDEHIVETISLKNRGRVQIHCVAFGLGGRNLLHAIANKNKGKFTTVSVKGRKR